MKIKKRRPAKKSLIKAGKLLMVVFWLITSPAFAQTLKVAVAANLQSVIKVLRDDYKKKTGIDIEPIVGSSGNLTTQIKNGAPYDLFLSADMSFPEALYQRRVYIKKACGICPGQFDHLQ